MVRNGLRSFRRPGFSLIAVSSLATLLFHSIIRLDGFVPPVKEGGAIENGVQSRRQLLSTVGTVGAGSLLEGTSASASSMFGLDISFLDPPAPADVAKPPADAEVLPSGLITKLILRPSCALSVSQSLKSDKCEKALPYDKVRIDYTGWTPNGKMFDSSRLEKRVVRVNSVMPGWTEGLQLMSPGETRRFWIPAELAFGSNSTDSSKPAGPLVFDIELFSIERQPKPPAELNGAPTDVSTTESGLAYKRLKPGTSDRSPVPESNVTAFYNGWSSNGDLILSTSFGAQATFLVKDIPIPGLLEGIQLMKEGETTRFWVPERIAFGDRAGKGGLPAGTLVFDIKLEGVN